MKKIEIVLIGGFLVFVLSCTKQAILKEGDEAVAKDRKALVLFDFEDDKEIKELYKENGPGDVTKDYPVEKVTDHATSGKYALKVTFPDVGDWPGIHFLKFKTDWSNYDILKVDVYNPTEEVVALNFAGADKDAGFTNEAYFGQYNLRFHASMPLKPGKNTFEIDLSGVTVEDGSRAVDLKNMKRFALFVTSRPKGLVLYFDNIRLEVSE